MNAAPRKRMGEVLIELGLVDEGQLKKALDLGRQENLRLGEALICLGYLREDQVLDILKDLADIEVLEMDSTCIDKEVQTLLPSDRMHELMVIPLQADAAGATVAFADPLDYVAVERVKFLLSREVSPVLASRSQILDILDALDELGYGRHALELTQVRRKRLMVTIREMNLDKILSLLDDPQKTNLHLTVGSTPAVRSQGVFTRSKMPMITSEVMQDLITELLPKDRLNELRKSKEIEHTCIRNKGQRYRINVYTHRAGDLAVSARRLLEIIPTREDLGLPDALVEALDKHGIVLVSSTRGHGKDATIAALVDHINSTTACNIITYEDPIEYIHPHKLSNVNQRELGMDTAKESVDAFQHVFRHDPDVLVITDIKNPYMGETAVLAAQKGIRVIAGINAVDVFSAIEQVRATLPDDYLKELFLRSMSAVFAQRMLPTNGRRKHILVWEMLLLSNRIRNYIRDNKAYNIKGQASSHKDEYFPMEKKIAASIRAGYLEQEKVATEPYIDREMLDLYLSRVKGA